MIFFQKNILEQSLGFHGDFKKRCLLTTGGIQIMYLTKLISEIKYIPSEGFFTILVFFYPR